MRNWFRRNKGTLVFFMCFGVFRLAIADWNPVPTGSMRPTILEGDVVFINRLAYDLKLPLTDIALIKTGNPQRGDIVTFSSPQNGTRLIKRIVGIPGDKIAMQNGLLMINGQLATYENPSMRPEALNDNLSTPVIHATEQIAGNRRNVQFLPAVNARRDFAEITVPADAYFMLGDNRDNSEDSRYIGFVPRQRIIGQANRLLVSADILANWIPRFERFGQSLQ